MDDVSHCHRYASHCDCSDESESESQWMDGAVQWRRRKEWSDVGHEQQSHALLNRLVE